MISRWLTVLGALALLVATFVPEASAQDLYAYPTKGQSQAQQEQDEFQCYNWAKRQTGFDPMQVPQAGAPPPQKDKGGIGILGGAAGGGALGAIGGLIAGKPGTGAAIGAATGGILGGLTSEKSRKNNEKARKDWERRESAQYQQGRTNYNRAYSACMSGRGYSVS